MPYQPANPKREAKANDPATWSSFDLAWEVYQSGALDGIGYEFAVDDPNFGVALSRRSRLALISCSVPQAHDDAKTITPDWVSTRILDVWLQYSAKFFAEQAKLELKQPNASEQEFFMKLADVRPMLDAAKRSGREVTSETADRLSAWVLDKGLAGLTEGDARCRKLIH